LPRAVHSFWSAVAWLGRRYAASWWLKGAIVALVAALMALNVISLDFG